MNLADSTLPRNTTLRRTLRLAVASTLGWWILSDNAGWSFGIAVIAITTATGLMVGSARTPALSPIAALSFMAFFFRNSLYSGIDVAYRAVHPRLPFESAWIEYSLRLPPGTPRILYINVITLMPGTLCADLKDNIAVVHLLHAASETATHELLKVEEHVAALFSISLENRLG
jgi:multicomponent Na+:H+ antiporter subunit E